jgi:hypothetical protein
VQCGTYFYNLEELAKHQESVRGIIPEEIRATAAPASLYNTEGSSTTMKTSGSTASEQGQEQLLGL